MNEKTVTDVAISYSKTYDTAQITTNFNSRNHNLWHSFALLPRNFKTQLATTNLRRIRQDDLRETLRNSHESQGECIKNALQGATRRRATRLNANYPNLNATFPDLNANVPNLNTNTESDNENKKTHTHFQASATLSFGNVCVCVFF